MQKAWRNNPADGLVNLLVLCGFTAQVFGDQAANQDQMFVQIPQTPPNGQQRGFREIDSPRVVIMVGFRFVHGS